MNNKLQTFDYANTPKVLQVKNLRVNFKSDSGLVYAVRGVSFDLFKGETLCIVGESGSGKSVTSKTIMGILANNAIVESGQILYEGEDLIRISEEEFHRIRGTKIGMIFQDPLSSLNPIVKVGKQITEATLINRNILKKHYFELISKQLVALRNLDANVYYEVTKAKEEVKKIDSFLKVLNNKKSTVDDKASIAQDLSEYQKISYKNLEDEISTLKYRIEFLTNETYESNQYLDEEIKKARLENREKRLALFEEYLEKFLDANPVGFLNSKKEYVEKLIALFKEEQHVLKPILKKALNLRKHDAQIENKAYAIDLKNEHESKIQNLTSELEIAEKEVEYFTSNLNAIEYDRYMLIKEAEEKKNKINLFYKAPQEEINISKMSKKEEEILNTGNEEFDALLEKVKNLKKAIADENDRYINLTKITKKEAKKMAINVMKEVGIPLPEKRFKQYPFEFSGGMRQRIVIAIALTANPDILICDEPTTALDVTIQAQILELINKLKRERGLSCIFITHDLGVVANMADRVAVMYAGKIVEYGTSYEIFYNPKHPYTWALLSSIPDIDSKEKLDAIPGTPPDMRFPPKGDAFALRSKYALDIDFKYEPPFFKVSDTHYAATWLLHEDAPEVEMPRIVRTRIANSLKNFEENNSGDEELLKTVVPEESFTYIDTLKSDLAKQALMNKDIKLYQSYEDGQVEVSKERKTQDAYGTLTSQIDELDGLVGQEKIDELETIKTKCKFKQEYVDNKIILSVNHLKQYFFFGKGPNRYKLKAVHDVNFQIKEGECFGIVGESGCGKTTTGRSIIRLYHITSGSIYYKGYRIGAGSRWNEKEIKFTKIRYKKRLRELKDLLDKSEITFEEYEEKVKEATERKNNICSVQKAKIAQIKHDDKAARRISLNDEEIAISKRKLSILQNEIKNTTDSSKLDELHSLFEHEKQVLNNLKKGNHKIMSEIQMIFQDPIDSLDPRMTVEDIIQEGLKIQGYTDKKENHKKVVDILEKVGLIADYCNRYPHEFSGGQRQRIGIARALIMNPKLLICDEPISALDVSIRAQIINLLNDLKEEMGLSIIFIAHDLSVVKYFCDRIAVMYFGEIVELATSDELFRHPLHPYTKSLLSAIPKPNPLSEKNRHRIAYNPHEAHDYSVDKPSFVEIEPGHFILANNAEVLKYKIEMAELDKQAKMEDDELNKIIEEETGIKIEEEPKEEIKDIKNDKIQKVDKPIDPRDLIIETDDEDFIEDSKSTRSIFVMAQDPVIKDSDENESLETDVRDLDDEDLKNNEDTTTTRSVFVMSVDDVIKAREEKEKKRERNPDHKKVYHLKKVNGKWEIILKDGKKVIKTFATKEEGIKNGKALAESQNGTLLVHASKGKNKGKFQKV